MEVLIAIDLTVIAFCFVVMAVGVVVLTVVGYRLLKKVEEGVDTVNNQLKPAVLDLKETITTINESLKVVSSSVSFLRKFKKKGE